MKACSVPSSRCSACSMLPRFIIRAVCLYQPPPGSRQRGADRAPRQPGRGGYLIVAEPFGLQEQRLAVPRAQLVEGAPDRLLPFASREVLLRARLVPRLGLEELAPPALPRGTPSVLPHQIERDREQPRPRVVRRRLERAGERLLGYVLGTIAVADAA